jgi:hypothetical protein
MGAWNSWAQTVREQIPLEHTPPLNTISITAYGLAPVAVFERLFPLSNTWGLIGCLGGFYYGGNNAGFSIGTSLYAGNPQKRFEIGVVHLNNKLTISYAAYRCTSQKGLFVKAGLGYVFIDEPGPAPILAVGYAF